MAEWSPCKHCVKDWGLHPAPPVHIGMMPGGWPSLNVALASVYSGAILPDSCCVSELIFDSFFASFWRKNLVWVDRQSS